MSGNKKSQRNWVVYGGKLSYFTMKTLAGFDFVLGKENFDFEYKTLENKEELETRSGTGQIPVVKTPSNWIISDSTPIFHYLDKVVVRNPELKLLNITEDAFTSSVVMLLEEYFDEFTPRIVVHLRWHFKESSDVAGPKLAREQLGESASEEMVQQIADSICNWGKRACKATGCDSVIQREQADLEIFRVFNAFENHLVADNRRFVLGDAPCAIDAVILGAIRAHLLEDAHPRKTIMSKLKYLTVWAEELADQYALEWRLQATGKKKTSTTTTLKRELLRPESLPPFITFMLEEIRDHFKPYAAGMAKAIKENKKAYVANVYGEDVSYLSREYVEYSRKMLRQQLPTNCPPFLDLLKEYKLEQLYSPLLVENNDSSSSSKL